MYACSHPLGIAVNQMRPYIKPEGIRLSNVAELIKILETAFSHPDKIATAECEMNRICQKDKAILHLLLRLPDDLRRSGME